MSIRNTRDIAELMQRVETLEERLDLIAAPPSGSPSENTNHKKRKYTRKAQREINA